MFIVHLSKHDRAMQMDLLPSVLVGSDLFAIYHKSDSRIDDLTTDLPFLYRIWLAGKS